MHKASPRPLRTLVIGAGGHGQVVADILYQLRGRSMHLAPLGYLDDDPQKHGETLLGLPVLGALDKLAHVDHDAVVLGIGANRLRFSLYTKLDAARERFVVLIHPSTIVATHVEIAPGAVVCAGVVINPAVTLSANVILNTGCTVDHHAQIAAHVHIGPGAHLGGDVTVGQGTLIGIGATVLPQRTIGQWAVVGAGAVVTQDVPDFATVVGVPARIIRRNSGPQPSYAGS